MNAEINNFDDVLDRLDFGRPSELPDVINNFLGKKVIALVRVLYSTREELIEFRILTKEYDNSIEGLFKSGYGGVLICFDNDEHYYMVADETEASVCLARDADRVVECFIDSSTPEDVFFIRHSELSKRNEFSGIMDKKILQINLLTRDFYLTKNRPQEAALQFIFEDGRQFIIAYNMALHYYDFSLLTDRDVLNPETFIGQKFSLEMEACPAPKTDNNKHVFFLEEAKSDSVKEVLGYALEHWGKNFVVEEKPNGCLCYFIDDPGRESYSLSGFFSMSLSGFLRMYIEKYLYKRAIGFSKTYRDTFFVSITTGKNNPVLYYFYPAIENVDNNNIKTIDSIDGKTDPKEILALFDVPPELLGL